MGYYNCFIRYTHNMRESIPKFRYTGLGAFTFHVLSEPRAIRRLLLKCIMAEWAHDHAVGPDEPWTVEWMERLPRMQFALHRVAVSAIRPRPDLMAYERPGYSFVAELDARVEEREQALQRGCSMEPLLIDASNMELMDGYVRYTLLCRHRQRLAYAYLGVTGGRSGTRYRSNPGERD